MLMAKPTRADEASPTAETGAGRAQPAARAHERASAPEPAGAAEPARASESAVTQAPAKKDEDEADYHYRWRRFGVWDYIGTAAVLGAYYTVEFQLKGPKKVHWKKPVPLLDPAFRHVFRLRTRHGRETADHLSDYFWYANVAYPVLDSIVTPLVRGAGFDMSWQLTMMNLQAFAITSLVIRLPHKTLGRARPNRHECEKNPEYDAQCKKPWALRVSFPGGHFSVSMTGAGLSCAHHLHGHLYGGGTADSLACAGAIVAANAVDILRLQTDKHWFSDDLVGGLLGFAIGYGMPTWFYYKPFWRKDDRSAQRSARHEQKPAHPRPFAWTVMPQVGQDRVGVAALGVF